MNFTKFLTNAVTLKSSENTNISPSISGVLQSYWSANKIKFPILLPVYLPLAMLNSAYVGMHSVFKSMMDVKNDSNSQEKNKYVKELTEKMTPEYFPSFKKFMENNPYSENSLLYMSIFKNLIHDNNKAGLNFLLNNVTMGEGKKQELHPKDGYLNSFANDLFLSLTFNIPLMKELMEERIIENFSYTRQKSISINVEGYKDIIPFGITKDSRQENSNAKVAVEYLNTLPSVLKTDYEEPVMKKKM